MPTEAELRQPLSPLAINISESAPVTLTEQQITLPVNIESSLGVLFKHIVFSVDGIGAFTPPGADTVVFTQEVDVGISLVQGLAGFPSLADPRTLAACHMVIGAASAPADAGVSISIAVFGDRWDFNPGILVVDQTISLYIVSTGLTTASTARARLSYQLVKVTPTEALSFALRSLG